MITKYNSKIGLGIVLFIALVLISTSIILIINQIWLGLTINLVVALFITYTLMTTYYVINGHDLIVKCGFLIHLTIDINKIQKITETNNPLSAPAASLDRLEICYNQHDTVMVSPKDKAEFINHLIAINSKIEGILKKDR